MKEIVLIVCLCVGAIIVGFAWLIIGKYLHRIKTKVSFKESLSKSELAIIPLWNNGLKLNFIIDSGSTCNLIDKSIVNKLSIIKENVDTSKIDSVSISGDINGISDVISMKLENESEIFFETFFVMDLKDAFDSTSNEYGEKIYGLLGTDFLTHYGKVIDYDNCIIYSK